MPAISYELLASDGRARLGRVTTRHGAFDTPAFMPVGTQGTIKGVLPDHVAATGSQIILANTYHLMLRPGREGRRASWATCTASWRWPGPILTDSGGFQVFSLADINQIDDDGVTFQEPHRRLGRAAHAAAQHAGAERSRGRHHHGVR